MTISNKYLFERVQKLLSIISTDQIGDGTLLTLIQNFGSFDEIPHKDITKINPLLRKGLQESFSGFTAISDNDIQKQISTMEETETLLVFYGDEDYPELLKQIKSPPPYLFMRGEMIMQDEISIAMVGTRRYTNYGQATAEKLAVELAHSGITVVSGFASGIDSIAHREAIKAGGRTIAVLGCGIDVIYPAFNKDLWRTLPQNGVMISQFPMGTAPIGTNFPKRNRLISGLSLGVLVVEAPVKSGALITAKHALEQNREVFAIPGDINSENSKGTNSLIQKGAKLVMDVDDILSEIGVVKSDSHDKPHINLNELSDNQKIIYESLSTRPIPIDTLSRRVGLQVNILLSDLSIMELKGFVRQFPGKQFVRAL